MGVVCLEKTSAERLSLCDDEELLDRIRGDDTEAYRVLVERHIDRTYALALRVLRNAADAEDVAQDSLVKVWTHRQTWQTGKAKFTTWLYRVVVNRCIDLQRRAPHDCIDDVPEIADDCRNAIDGIHDRQIHEKLEHAMARLPPQQRTAVTLAYFEDLSNGEIAIVMNTTLDAVESLLKRGRRRLHELLQGSSRDVNDSFSR